MMEVQVRRPDFGPIAASYDKLRPEDREWLELFDAVVEQGDLLDRKVLDVGCGTGRFAARLTSAGVEAWGVEPAAEMAAQARARLGDKVVEAEAEALPLPSESFDRVSMWRVAHLVKRPAAFAESCRVLAFGGRMVIATLDPSCLGGYWLNRFFPSIEKIDRGRYPRAEELSGELATAGFRSVQLGALRKRVRIDREAGLEQVRNRFMSTLMLLDDEEYAAGLERLERELPRQTEYDDEWIIAVGQKR